MINTFILLTTIFFYIIFIISFYLYIFYLQKNWKTNNFLVKKNNISLIKDKEYLLFKETLIKFYYSTFIILFIFLLKQNGGYNIKFLLDLNIYFIYFVSTIFIFYSILLSDYFNMKLFYSYKEIKKNINYFNETFSFYNLSPFSYSLKKTNNILKRNYSTSTSSNNNLELDDPEINYQNSEFNLDDKESSLIKTEAIKEFKKTYSGGYLGYNLIYSLGSVLHFIYEDNFNYLEQYTKELEIKLNIFLKEIPENVTYSIIPFLRREYLDGDYKSISITNSIKVTRFTSSGLLSEKIVHSLLNKLLVYSLKGSDIELIIMGRPWLNSDDFNIKFSEVTNILDKQIEKENSNLNETLIIKNKIYSEKALKLKNYLYSNVFMDNYGEQVFDKNKNLIGYKLNENKYISLITYFNDDNLLCNKIFIKEFDIKNLSFNKDCEPIDSWVDTKTEYGFIREYDNKKFYYDKFNNIINVEVNFSCPQFPLHKKENKLNEKIGTIDFETFGPNLGLGHHQVYAAGFAIKDHTELFYIDPDENSDDFVYNFFFNLFLYQIDLNEYTFYVHNLGRFDSIFIIKALTKNNEFTVIPTWKDNSILSITIKYLNTKIVLLDSLQLIPGDLDSILNSFNCVIKKGKFPYKVVNKKSLYFEGKKPDKKFYNNISDKEYLTIPEKGWSLKSETLNYLKSDVEGLLEALIKFNNNIFNKYNLNITKFKTLPGLVLATYTSIYVPDNLKSELKMIKGDLEKEIRSAYFGGNVDVFINTITTGYLYDINSQYSKAMLNDMPIGDPILSLEKDLNKIFGFVYGEITAPDENTLQVPFIQHKDPLWKLSNCPRGKFSRLIFSEEIKYALKYGYKFNVEYSYQFKRGKDLFKSYVDYHYGIKTSTNDPVQKTIAKLFLNSLYGRLGIKETENTIKFVDKNEVRILDKNTNVSIISELENNKFMVRYKGKITDNIRKTYSKDPLIPENNKTKVFSKADIRKLGFNKTKDIPSAIHIAAAISSYARIIINDYKNIPGNLCVMSDTDSVVLTKPLPDKLVGEKIGQMKLEQEIVNGIFIKKKLYYLKNSNNQEIIKSSGVHSSNLNKNSFKLLLEGESISIESTNFNVEWKPLGINVVSFKVIIQGLKREIRTIYNTPDSNFKSISFPIQYNLIIHPEYAYTTVTANNNQIKENNIKINTPSVNILQDESDLFLIFSKLEIIIFLITLILLIILIFIYKLIW